MVNMEKTQIHWLLMYCICAEQSVVFCPPVCLTYFLSSQWFPVFPTMLLDKRAALAGIYGSIQSHMAGCGQTARTLAREHWGMSHCCYGQ